MKIMKLNKEFLRNELLRRVKNKIKLVWKIKMKNKKKIIIVSQIVIKQMFLL
jgi:hypothetical protein